MKRCLLTLSVLLLAAPLSAQQSAPEMSFDSVPDFLGTRKEPWRRQRRCICFAAKFTIRNADDVRHSTPSFNEKRVVLHVLPSGRKRGVPTSNIHRYSPSARRSRYSIRKSCRASKALAYMVEQRGASSG